MKFSEVIGLNKEKEFLVNSVKSNHISHAQMFFEAGNYGALALAIAYSGYILCSNKGDKDACGECPSCKKVSSLTHPDLHFIYPVNKGSKQSKVLSMVSMDTPVSSHFIASWREKIIESPYFTETNWYDFIGLENRQGNISKTESLELIKKINVKSYQGGYKIVILWLVEKMHQTATNAILKLLEEPPEGTLFILISKSKDFILPTILSRVQELRVSRIEEDILASYLETKLNISVEEAANIAKVSNGDMVRSLSLYSEDDAVVFNHFVSLMRLSYQYVGKYLEVFKLIEELSKEGREYQKLFLIKSMEWVRECFVLNKEIDDISMLTLKRREFCLKLAPFINSKNIIRINTQFEKALLSVTYNGNSKMIFTNLAINISKLISR